MDENFVMTELFCALALLGSGSYITVLVGQERRTNVGFSPHSQVRRVVSLKVTSNTTVVLAQLDTSLMFTDYVNKLCLDMTSTKYNSCFVSGASHSSYTNVLPVTVEPCLDILLCLEFDDVVSIYPDEPINWSGNYFQ